MSRTQLRGLFAARVVGVSLAVALTAAPARGQVAGGYSAVQPAAPASQPAAPESQPAAPASQPGRFETVLTASPMWSQDRNFLGVRFWKLDPHHYELELWYKGYYPPPDSHTLSLELEMGLTRRLQLDVYENAAIEIGSDGKRHFSHKGNAIELRIAIPERYGQIWGNPVVYLEWVANHGAPDRAEVRVLLGGELFTPRLLGAVNLVFECNADTINGEPYQGEPEFGVTAAASYEVLRERLRLGAEIMAIFTREKFRNSTTEREIQIGPNLSWHVIGHRLKLYTTLFFGLGGNAPTIAPWVILGTAW
jgi:hypothetical protein